jgi:PAS domain S-box-containing protein
MLENKIINNAEIKKYYTYFNQGDTIFFEGDNSQDLFILVSGELDVFKGNKHITKITKQGAPFGEITFFFNTERTATVKALNSVTAIQIPKNEISVFLHEFPTISWEITILLAQRLDKTSRILYGLKEISDQLPDAVIVTDKEGKIITWNNAAEELYGRQFNEMHNSLIENIYESPELYKKFIEEVRANYSVREKIFKIKHPENRTLFVSTSTTFLYDGHHNFQGVISLGRDVTDVVMLEKKYKNVIQGWIIFQMNIDLLKKQYGVSEKDLLTYEVNN